MRFSDVIGNVKIKSTNIKNFDFCITSICSDTQKLSYGDVFVCISGTKFDSHTYIAEAYALGARSFVVERVTEVLKRSGYRYIQVESSKLAEVMMLYDYFGRPCEDMTLIGVTGTNGKTSVSYMLKRIFDFAGFKTGLIGTVKSLAGNIDLTAPGASDFNSMTTPSPHELYSTLYKMKNAGVAIVIIEASSHALDQRRLDALSFSLGIFTNLTEDHLDYHKSFSEYFKAKRHLFDLCDNALINIDSQYGKALLELVKCAAYSYGLSRCAGYRAENVVCNNNGVSYKLCDTRIKCPIIGRFSVYNSLCAIAGANILKIGADLAAEAIENMDCIIGRLEKFELPSGATAYIDYAHTPDALKNVLDTLKSLDHQRIITVFGCGGDREREKRPIMGHISTLISDLTIITNDNPRYEKPDRIIADIVSGIVKDIGYTIIPERRKAIQHALSISKTGDIILLAGKGHEDYEIINGVKSHFSEREIIEEYIKETKAKGKT